VSTAWASTRWAFAEEAGDGAVDMMRAIKQALDPKNILNPGKIFVL
jgi:D-lactate dehydrogenase (cytochrome)